MTETAGIYSISDRTDSVETRATAQGKPCPGVEIRIIDIDGGDDVGPGAIGEILVRGHNVMEGCYRDPEKTRRPSTTTAGPAMQCVEVVGVPDPRLDEVPVAFVEVKTGHDVIEADLIAFCEGRIALFRIPRAVHFVAPGTWPMSATKIDERELRPRLDGTPTVRPTREPAG